MYVRWIFPDSVPETGAELQFVELQAYEKGQVMMWLGKSGDYVGDFRCFPSAIKNFKELVQKLGKDEKAWQGKIFLLRPTEDKKKFIAQIL